MFAPRILLTLLFGLVVSLASAALAQKDDPPKVKAPPKSLKLDPFYKKYVSAKGLAVISSKNVPDEALVMAAELINKMLANRKDLRQALIKGKAQVAVMGKKEVTTDIPEHSKLKPKEHWDKRARGLGGTPFIPTTSCAEENLLGYEDDPYCGENILIHEFAHTIHEIGMKALDKTFDGRLKKLHEKALKNGLWKNTYAATNHAEYWAEGVQSYFDCNAQAKPADGIHNHVRTRERLQKYDSELAKLIDEVFAKNDWRWEPNGAHAPKWKGEK